MQDISATHAHTHAIFVTWGSVQVATLCGTGITVCSGRLYLEHALLCAKVVSALQETPTGRHALLCVSRVRCIQSAVHIHKKNGGTRVHPAHSVCFAAAWLHTGKGTVKASISLNATQTEPLWQAGHSASAAAAGPHTGSRFLQLTVRSTHTGRHALL